MNIQKIQAQVEVVLDGYNVDYSHSQIKALVGQWYLAKEDLISVLRNHPNWNEDDLAVAFNADIERKIDVDAFYHELNKLKTAHAIDYETFCGLYPLCATTLVDDSNGLVFKDNGVRVQKGMKMPRAIGKLFEAQKVAEKFNEYFAVTHSPQEKNPFDTIFASLADSISPLKGKRPAVLSVHPCDYLNMSKGNSWHSCQLLPDGEYCAGTLSYMGDKTSMVFYTVSANYKNTDRQYWNQSKIDRQLFFYGGGKLLQSRLYPQKNETAINVIDNFRNIVQQIMATALDTPNQWTVTRGRETYDTLVLTCGDAHYEDYFIEDYCHSCTLSKSRELADYSAIRIGSIAHCVNCGKELYDSSTIVCECCEDDRNTCSRCGAIIDEGDEYGLPNLEIICPQCYADNFETCPHCGCVYENENMTEVHNGDFICRDCLGKSYFYCEECNEYYPLYQQDDDGLCENCTKKNEQQEAM